MQSKWVLVTSSESIRHRNSNDFKNSWDGRGKDIIGEFLSWPNDETKINKTQHLEQNYLGPFITKADKLCVLNSFPTIISQEQTML